jgi:hypothetical protein
MVGVAFGEPRPLAALLVIVVVDEFLTRDGAVVTEDNAEGDGHVVESGLQLGESRGLLFEFSTKFWSLRSSLPGSIGSNQGEIKKNQ